MGVPITKQELSKMLRDRPTKRDLRATLDDALKAYPTKRELKRDLGNLLHHYATKRDLMVVKRDLDKSIDNALKRQDKRFAKRIVESEAWSERVFATNERVDRLEGNMIRRFNETDGKMDALEHRLTDRIEASEERIIGAMQAIVTQVNRRLEKRVAVLERKST